MSIPNYYEFYRDVLDALQDGLPHTSKDIRSQIAQNRGFSSEDLKALLPSGSQTVFANRVGWAITYLRSAGLVERPARGSFRITEEGRAIQQNGSIVLNDFYLLRYPSFAEFKHPKEKKSPPVAPFRTAADPILPPEEESDPQEAIDTAYRQLNAALAQQLLEEILSRDSDFFERLVVKLLRNMGYGGPFEDAFQVTQRTNDGGIDGIIKEDPLGFSKIYIQAKRWDPSTVIGRPEIQKFCGALQDAGAHRGLYITTAKYSAGAVETAARQHLVLVDGPLLTRLMIEYNLGVSTTHTYAIKEVDNDFFDEEER